MKKDKVFTSGMILRLKDPETIEDVMYISYERPCMVIKKDVFKNNQTDFIVLFSDGKNAIITYMYDRLGPEHLSCYIYGVSDIEKFDIISVEKNLNMWPFLPKVSLLWLFYNTFIKRIKEKLTEERERKSFLKETNIISNIIRDIRLGKTTKKEPNIDKYLKRSMYILNTRGLRTEVELELKTFFTHSLFDPKANRETKEDNKEGALSFSIRYNSTNITSSSTTSTIY